MFNSQCVSIEDRGKSLKVNSGNVIKRQLFVRLQNLSRLNIDLNVSGFISNHYVSCSGSRLLTLSSQKIETPYSK
jgi:hypothetical protein